MVYGWDGLNIAENCAISQSQRQGHALRSFQLCTWMSSVPCWLFLQLVLGCKMQQLFQEYIST